MAGFSCNVKARRLHTKGGTPVQSLANPQRKVLTVKLGYQCTTNKPADAMQPKTNIQYQTPFLPSHLVLHLLL
jgi:hypothetical protein